MIPEDIKQKMKDLFRENSFKDSLYDTMDFESRMIYGKRGYSLALPKIEEQQQEISLLNQSYTYQLSQIGKLFSDKMELAEEIKRLKDVIAVMNLESNGHTDNALRDEMEQIQKDNEQLSKEIERLKKENEEQAKEIKVLYSNGDDLRFSMDEIYEISKKYQ